MAAHLITTDDLREFKMELLDAIEKKIQNNKPPREREWLKTSDVRELLGVSAGTMATLRNSGKIPFTKIGGLIFYRYDDIQRVLEENKVEAWQR